MIEKILKFNSLLNGTETDEQIEALAIEQFGGELNTATSIDIRICELREFPKCIKYFKNLTNLYCTSNKLTNIDISKNVNLTHLYCSSNQLTNLDISNNLNLKYLYCSSNQLTNLDISNSVNLTGLECNINPNFKHAGLYDSKSKIDELRQILNTEQRLEKLNNIFEN